MPGLATWPDLPPLLMCPFAEFDQFDQFDLVEVRKSRAQVRRIYPPRNGIDPIREIIPAELVP